MRNSLMGYPLPETHAEFIELEDAQCVMHTHCVSCTQPFSALNTTSAPGWRDTQIVGMCEACYDTLMV